MELATDVYRLVELLPSNERFELSAQLRRATISIPANIAEGFGYGAGSRNIHHVQIALGSNLELQTQLLLIQRLRLAAPNQVEPILNRAVEVGKMLNGSMGVSLERCIDASHA